MGDQPRFLLSRSCAQLFLRVAPSVLFLAFLWFFPRASIWCGDRMVSVSFLCFRAFRVCPQPLREFHRCFRCLALPLSSHTCPCALGHRISDCISTCRHPRGLVGLGDTHFHLSRVFSLLPFLFVFWWGTQVAVREGPFLFPLHTGHWSLPSPSKTQRLGW